MRNGEVSVLMGLAEWFHQALARTATATGLTGPSAMAAAAADALQLHGAGISLADDNLRLPLGASSPDVAVAEQLQATLGDGPCLTATRTGRLVASSANEIADRWPLYHSELIQRTPFRAVAAVPLVEPGGVFAALNLYSSQPARPHLPAGHTLATAIAQPISGLLLGVLDALGPLEEWDSQRIEQGLGASASAHRLTSRLDAWTAVGMLMSAGPLDDTDALAVLRGYAFRRGRTIEQVAGALVHRRLATQEVLDDTSG